MKLQMCGMVTLLGWQLKRIDVATSCKQVKNFSATHTCAYRCPTVCLCVHLQLKSPIELSPLVVELYDQVQVLP